MSNQDFHMDTESTYLCPHCHCDILTSNQFTHEVQCARRQAANNQRPAQPMRIQRENSSSGLPDTIDYSNRRPQIREERNIVQNKLITCPNCEKSVREQDFAAHSNTCEGNDRIPCEFCDQLISMPSYTQHIEQNHRREQEEERLQHQQRQQEQHRSNQRASSPGRGMISRQNQEAQEDENQGFRSQEQRDRSPVRNASQENSGGFMGFLRSLVQTATQNRSEPEQRPQPQPQSQSQPREQPQSSTRSLFSRLMEHHNHHDHDDRRAPMTMEDFFLRSIQARNQAERANARENQGHFMGSAPQQSGRTVRTINLGPRGTLVFSTGTSAMEEPEDYWQSVGVPQRRPNQMNMNPMEDMGPMGLLLSMLSQGNQGMRFGISPEQLHQLEEEGMSKEDIDSLSVVKYDAEKNKNLSEDMKSCPICLEEFEDGDETRFLWCLHRFHRKCVDQWLDKHTNCPICKKDFSEMEHNPESA